MTTSNSSSKEPKLKSLYLLELKYFNKLTLHSFPLTFNESQNDTIHMETQPRCNKILKWILLAHTLTYLIKGAFIFESSVIDDISVDGNQMTRISNWMICLSVGVMSYTFFLYKGDELTTVVNGLLNIDFIKESQGVAFIVINGISISTIVPIIYTVTAIYSNIDPITAYLEHNVEQLGIFYRMLMIIFRVLDLWNYWYLCRLTCFLVFEIMFASYVAMLLLVCRLHSQQTNYKNTSQPLCKIKQSVTQYKQIVIYTEMVNNCFRFSIALPYKLTVVIFGILMGTAALNKNLRSSAKMDAFCFSVYSWVNLILFLAVGYSIPGVVNEVSKRIKQCWANMLAERMRTYVRSTKLLRELRRHVKATRDIRFYFGGVHYYEKYTGVIILKFMMDSMINLVLMM